MHLVACFAQQSLCADDRYGDEAFCALGGGVADGGLQQHDGDGGAHDAVGRMGGAGEIYGGEAREFPHVG